MNLGLVLLTEGTAATDVAAGFRAACAALRPGDRLIVTDSGSDPDLTEAIDAVAQPEALPAGALLMVLRFGAVPPGSWGAQGNAALAEVDDCETLLLISPADHVVAGALAAARDRMAESGAEIILAGGAAPPPPEVLADRASQNRLDWISSRAPTPMLVRRGWVQARGLRLPESGPAPDRRWQWQICALAERIGWQAVPLGHGAQPSPVPSDADTLLALHQGLLEGLPADLAGLAHGWLIGALADLPADLPAETRWPVAQRLTERLAPCPDPLWQQIMARNGHRQAAIEADALRRGQLLEVIALWTQAATEARLARLETGLKGLQQGLVELAALRQMLDSLCRIAEYEALSAGWSTTGAACDTAPAHGPEERSA